MGVLAGGEEGVGEFQGVKSYLWVASLRVGGDRRGAGGGSSTSAAVMAACGGAPAREDDGAAMEGFSKAGRSGDARRPSTGARARGSRRAAACR